MKPFSVMDQPVDLMNDFRGSVPLRAVAIDEQEEQQTRLIRYLIWLYITLWLVEGGLRRWFLPGLSAPLLLIRDPVVVLIYLLAAAKNLFPMNAFVFSEALLAVFSLLDALLQGHGSIPVALYGARCDFLHVPLIFIMGRIIRPKDLTAFAKLALVISIPYTLLLVAQFYQPQDAWVNRGLGGNMDGAGFDGALDRFRPPGTFSFISGPSQLYPLFAACWFALLLSEELPVWLMIASGMSILITLPLSISRTLFLSVAIVATVGMFALFLGGRFSIRMLLQLTLGAVVLWFLAQRSLVFQDGMEAFSARWTGATLNEGGVKVAIVDRVLNDLFGAFGGVQEFGFGTGFSTNVGQKLLTQKLGFGAAEGEWGRLLYDNGLFLGALLVFYRISLSAAILYAGLRSWRQHSPVSLIFASAGFLLLLNGQWGQPTTLGSAVIGGGLALAAAFGTEAESSENRWETLETLDTNPIE
jgi:hypothetical protein